LDRDLVLPSDAKPSPMPEIEVERVLVADGTAAVVAVA
jgi:hypothetical protein